MDVHGCEALEIHLKLGMPNDQQGLENDLVYMIVIQVMRKEQLNSAREEFYKGNEIPEGKYVLYMDKLRE